MNKWIAEFELEDGDTMPEHMDLEYKGAKIDFHCKPLEQEPCEDAIRRADVLDLCDSKDLEYKVTHFKEDVECLPSVYPKPKTGHWIDIMVGDMPAQACDRCNTFYPLAYTGGGHKYCPNCGAKMVEPQESEGMKK